MEENVSEPDINPLNKQKKGGLSSDQVEPMLSYLLGDHENHHGEQVPWLKRMKMAVQQFASASVCCPKVGTHVITSAKSLPNGQENYARWNSRYHNKQ